MLIYNDLSLKKASFKSARFREKRGIKRVFLVQNEENQLLH